MYLTLKSFKITTNHIRSFIFRKHLEIITFISIIAFLCVLFRSHLFKTLPNYNPKTIETNISISPDIIKTQALNSSLNTILPTIQTTTTTTTESPLQRKLKPILNCHNNLLRPEKLQYGHYWLMKNYITGLKTYQIGCAESITYTTHGDFTFIEHLPRVVER